MADEPDNLVLQVLRDVRGKLDAMDERQVAFEKRVEDRLAALQPRADDTSHEITYALGMILYSDQIGEEREKRLDALMARPEALEQR